MPWKIIHIHNGIQTSSFNETLNFSKANKFSGNVNMTISMINEICEKVTSPIPISFENTSNKGVLYWLIKTTKIARLMRDFDLNSLYSETDLSFKIKFQTPIQEIILKDLPSPHERGSPIK